MRLCADRRAVARGRKRKLFEDLRARVGLAQRLPCSLKRLLEEQPGLIEVAKTFEQLRIVVDRAQRVLMAVAQRRPEPLRR